MTQQRTAQPRRAEAEGRMPGSTIISARGLTQTFAGAGGDQKVLDGLDLDMRRGDVTAIMGPSGAGKSTLLYALITR
ncbi:ABC transporter ATP-binding protein [Bifidobacterium anseris]|uniref:ABC transporter ATP-binding protein n=1 Tax=Bifidobacterium anseris TaxID=2020963 RepID=A0A2N5J2A0_9BIFI|nr:ATP-binding cassette domain-containing protein [Bifidobacterium anseris]PLS28319.1 ABC transporter ATP-binding protein [Bifidobacterium anseris]